MRQLVRLVAGALGISLLLGTLPLRTAALSGSEFQAGRIIDDAKFFNASPMSINDIQSFLNAKVPVCDTWGTQMHSSGMTRAEYSASRGVSTPFICLKEYRDTVTAKSAEAGLCNGLPAGSGTAAEIIFWVSESCGINPQVMLVLLQKEQSLVTDDWPWPIQYRSATGYGCPDTAPCDSLYYGFFNQVWSAARQFKRYGRDSHLFNYRAGVNNFIQYHPNAACGGSTVFIQNQATAGLYNYTPYQPNAAALNNLYGTGDGCSAYGNRNFWRIFNDWFGSTFGPPDYSCGFSGANIEGAGSGEKVITNKLGSGPELLTLTLLNNTGSKCIEVHTWTRSFQQWLKHTATNRPSINPADAELITGDTDGNGRDELMSVEYRNTGSGRIEVHVWDDTYQRWLAHVATNHAAIDPADADVIAADSNGDGRDELFLIQYRNTGSGKVEVHGWTPNLQGWFLHAATNYGAVNPADARVITSDVDGNGRDEFLLINYKNTASGKVEVHGWMPSFQQWFVHIATNHTAIDPGDGMVISSNYDGLGPDELIMVRYRNTGSGRIEVHGWMPSLQQWFLQTPVVP